jgi:hypothetical protein
LWIMSQIKTNFLLLIHFLTGFDLFGLLLLFLFYFKKIIFKKASEISLLFFLQTLLIACTWSLILEQRHLESLYILGLLLLGIIVGNLFSKKRFITILVICITLSIYLAYDINRIHWVRAFEKNEYETNMEGLQPIYRWVKENTSANAIIAYDNPGELAEMTKRPAIAIPQTITSDETYHYYITHFTITYVITSSPELSAVFNKKAKVVKKIGAHTIFDPH